MTTVVAFSVGVIVGAVFAIIGIVSGYGKDADDYYKGSKK